MRTFSYSALQDSGTYTKGTIDASSLRKARQELEKKNLSIITIVQEKKKTWLNQELRRGLPIQERILLTRHLHTMLEAGIGLDQALKTVAEQTTNEHIKTMLLDLFQRVQKGQPFHQALANHRKYFSELYINLVRVGETSGKLDDVLAYLLVQQEKEYALQTRVVNAMLYPTIILTALFAMVSLMMVLVIPKITEVLSGYNVSLPLQTRILVGTSNILSKFWYIIFPALFALVLALRALIRRPRGKQAWDDFILALPGVNTIVREVQLARLMRALNATLKSGLSLDQALELATTVTSNSRYRQSLQRATTFVRRGVPLGEVLHGYPKNYPPIATRMIDVGEKTGKLDHMLERLATHYEIEVDTKLANLSSIIEPALILFIGLVAGFVAISVMTPIWSFSQTV